MTLNDLVLLEMMAHLNPKATIHKFMQNSLLAEIDLGSHKRLNEI